MSDTIEIGTIKPGAEIGLDPKNRWVWVVCSNIGGDVNKGCGERRWARYYRSAGTSTHRLCARCNKDQAAHGLVFGYKARGQNA